MRLAWDTISHIHTITSEKKVAYHTQLPAPKLSINAPMASALSTFWLS